MRERHAGKWRDWFDNAAWSIALVDLSDLHDLVFLESQWTKDEGLVVHDRLDYRMQELAATHDLSEREAEAQ